MIVSINLTEFVWRHVREGMTVSINFVFWGGKYSDSDINNVHATVNNELVGVDNWLKANRLSLNVSKTSYIIISNQKKIDIKIRDSIVPKSQHVVKFLGFTLDENLTFSWQCKKRHY